MIFLQHVSLTAWEHFDFLGDSAAAATRFTISQTEMKPSRDGLWVMGKWHITRALSGYIILTRSLLKGVDSERVCFRKEEEGKLRPCSSSKHYSAAGDHGSLVCFVETCKNWWILSASCSHMLVHLLKTEGLEDQVWLMDHRLEVTSWNSLGQKCASPMTRH